MKYVLRGLVVAVCCFGFCLAGMGLVNDATAAEKRPSGKVIVMKHDTPMQTWELTTPGKAGTAEVQLKVTIKSTGQLAKGKKITGQLLMPEMPMDGYPVALEFVESEPGVYTTLAQYMHGGFWRISVAVPCHGTVVNKHDFDFDLAD